MVKEKSKALMKGEPVSTHSAVEEMGKRFEEFIKGPLSLLVPPWAPRPWMHEIPGVSATVDVFEEGGDVIVKAELPGMEKKDIDVKLTKNTVTISGEKKKEEKVEKKNYYKVERSYGTFSRAVSLPSEVLTDKAKAHYSNGVLVIRVPKTEEAKKKEKKVMIE
jgi:HSP20 family protein